MSDRTNNSIPKPLKDALKLKKDIERTRELRANCSRLKFATEERIRALQNELVEAYTRKARRQPNAQKDAERIDREINAARRSIESTDAEIQGAVRAEQQANDELEELLKRDLPTFIDEAEEETQEAIAAYDDLETAFREAFEAWQDAAQVWAPLRSAVHEFFKSQTEQSGFYLAESELMSAANVPPWPLQQPDELFPLPRAPRPPALEPQQDDSEPDDEEEDE